MSSPDTDIDPDEVDLAVVDWKATAENLQSEVTRLHNVIRHYVDGVEHGDRFDALVSSVPGLESDDGQYPSGKYAPREINTPRVRQAIAALIRDVCGPHKGLAERATGAVYVVLNRASAGLPLDGLDGTA
jgi:hypothetical protein